MIEVKICGVTRPEDVEAAADAGADYVGFHLGPTSSRKLDIETANALAEQAEGLGLRPVAVLNDPDDAALEALAGSPAFRFIQLGGKETPEDVERVVEITGLRVIKILPAATPQELARRDDFEAAHAFVFDPKGEWGLLRGARIARPWFLAGGLTPDNVADAVHASGALMVDVSSGVESAPGQKDADLMRAFVDAAQEGE